MSAEQKFEEKKAPTESPDDLTPGDASERASQQVKVEGFLVRSNWPDEVAVIGDEVDLLLRYDGNEIFSLLNERP